MNKDRILKNSLDIIRKYLNEDAPTMNTDPGKTGAPGFSSDSNPFGPVAGTTTPKKSKKGLFRRQTGVQQKLPS